jgi:hypothetical protein
MVLVVVTSSHRVMDTSADERRSEERHLHAVVILAVEESCSSSDALFDEPELMVERNRVGVRRPHFYFDSLNSVLNRAGIFGGPIP